MIRIRGLVKRFGSLEAVKKLDLSVPPGEIFGFLGPNGAGKTTTVRMLCGLIKPTEGRIVVAGFDMAERAIEAKRAVGLVPDEPFVYPKLSGAEYLRFIGELYGVPLPEARRRIPELLEMFELGGWGGELVESYSHGMRQKLVIAGVLLHQPKVLLLDEPMVGLDPKSARMTKDIFLTLAARGTTIFMCTHILEIAEKLCDRIGIMIAGELRALGTLEDLRGLARPAPKAHDPPCGPAPRSDLEDVFLSLTGGREYSELLKNL